MQMKEISAHIAQSKTVQIFSDAVNVGPGLISIRPKRWGNGVGAHSPIRSGRLASAPHSGQRGLLLGWRRQRCPRRLRRPRCWSPGPWSLCAGPPFWVPCTDSWDSTSARGSQSISASSALGGDGQIGADAIARRVDKTLRWCFAQATELEDYCCSTGGWCST